MVIAVWLRLFRELGRLTSSDVDIGNGVVEKEGVVSSASTGCGILKLMLGLLAFLIEFEQPILEDSGDAIVVFEPDIRINWSVSTRV